MVTADRWWPLAGLLVAQASWADDPGYGPAGYRITPVWSGSGAAVTEEASVGGGASSTRVAAAYAAGDWRVEIAVPVAAYTTPGGRVTGLGNPSLAVAMALPDAGALRAAVELRAHTHVGPPAWAWVERADEVWPSTGVDVAWQGAVASDGPGTLLLRGSAGVLFPQAYDPYPGVAARFGAAVGGDWALGDVAGVVVESSLAYWDVSPWEAAALLRVDALGARGRAGVVLPLATWAGLTPADLSGVREVAVVAEIGVAL